MSKHNLKLTNEKYSEKELEENCHLFSEFNWRNISGYQNLSENFIEKHKDKVDWDYISCYQKISEEFIKKHINKINFGLLMKSKKISNKIKEEIKLLKEII